jgi:hypothetical protein
MTDKYASIIEELQRAEINLVELWTPLGTGHAHVSLRRAGKPDADDVTPVYTDGLRKTADALLKAIAVLKNPT